MQIKRIAAYHNPARLLSSIRGGFINPFRAKRKIPVIKKPDNYLNGRYTFFPAGNPVLTLDFLSPVVNWLEKTRS